MRRAFTRSLFLSVLLSTALSGTFQALAANTPAAQPAQQGVTPKIGKILTAAQEAMQKESWDEALAKLAEAQAVSDPRQGQRARGKGLGAQGLGAFSIQSCTSQPCCRRSWMLPSIRSRAISRRASSLLQPAAERRACTDGEPLVRQGRPRHRPPAVQLTDSQNSQR